VLITVKKNKESSSNLVDEAEKRVALFYINKGWVEHSGVTEDARRFEDLRQCAADYVSKCRLRVMRHIPASGECIIDMASGPIQYAEYLKYSSGFKKRYCVDLSADALSKAKELLGEHGEYLHGSFFDLNLKDDFFDCAVSLHTIYHIDKHKQEEAVRKLIRIVKKGQPVIVIYSNPNAFYSNPNSVLRRLVKAYKVVRGFGGHRVANVTSVIQVEPDLYFYRYELNWWQQFEDIANVKILPWRTFGTEIQKKFFPNNLIGKLMFKILFYIEDLFPQCFTKFGVYPMIVMIKK
jgi:ubiquinone/menaquinone biosynthesis C-methylase UbiE